MCVNLHFRIGSYQVVIILFFGTKTEETELRKLSISVNGLFFFLSQENYSMV